MAFIGNIAIKLSANTTGLKADFAKAQKDVEGFAKSIEKALSFATSIPGLSALGGVFSVDKIKDSLQGLVDLNKEATKLGFTIQQLSALENIGGLDADKFSKGIKKLSEAMTEAAIDPAGEMAKKFKLIGFDSEKELEGGPLRAIMKFADIIKGQSPAERLWTTNILGKEGDDLINFLKVGGPGIKGLMEEQLGKGRVRTWADVAIAQESMKLHSEASKDIKSTWDTFSLGFSSLMGKWGGALWGGWMGAGVVNMKDLRQNLAQLRGQAGTDITAPGPGVGDQLGLARVALANRNREEAAKSDEEFWKEMDKIGAAKNQRIVGIAQGLLGAPSTPLPTAALFGSQEAKDFFAKVNEPAKDMEQAVKEALEQDNWQQEHARKIAQAIGNLLGQPAVVSMDGAI